jgi:hypothetical protein
MSCSSTKVFYAFNGVSITEYRLFLDQLRIVHSVKTFLALSAHHQFHKSSAVTNPPSSDTRVVFFCYIIWNIGSLIELGQAFDRYRQENTLLMCVRIGIEICPLAAFLWNLRWKSVSLFLVRGKLYFYYTTIHVLLAWKLDVVSHRNENVRNSRPNLLSFINNNEQNNFHKLIVTHQIWMAVLVAGFPSRRPGFGPGSGHVGFEVDNVALSQVFSEYFRFPCQFSFHQLLHSHHHLSSGAGTIGRIVAEVPVHAVSNSLDHKFLHPFSTPKFHYRGHEIR